MDEETKIDVDVLDRMKTYEIRSLSIASKNYLVLST